MESGTALQRPLAPESKWKNKTEGIDVDNAEGGDFDEEEDAEEEDIGEFWGGMENPGSVARVGREEAAEDCEMWADLYSVWNSKVEAVPIIWDLELSINDSVSPVISFISGDILPMFNRTTNWVKVVVEMKAAWTMQITYRQRQQWKSKFLRNQDGRSTKGFHANLQTHWMGVYAGKSSTVHWMGC